MRKILNIFLFCAIFFHTSITLYAKDMVDCVIPERFGKITSRHQGAGDRFVINIQDAHCIYDAQYNITQILTLLMEQTDIDIVAIEGAQGKIDGTEYYSFPNTEIRKYVANYFLKKGSISGSEFMLIANEFPFVLRGVDQREQYLDNYNAFRLFMSKKERALNIVDKLLSDFEVVGNTLLPDILKKYLDTHKDYHSHDLEVADFCRYLIEKESTFNIDIAEYSQLDLIKQTMKLEDKINFDLIGVEHQSLMDSFTKTLDEESVTELLSNNLQYKLKKISPHVYYTDLEEVAEMEGFDLSQYANLKLYITYLKLHNRVSIRELSIQINDLEQEIIKQMCKTDESLFFCGTYFALNTFRKFVGLYLVAQELEETRVDDISAEKYLSFIKKYLFSPDVPDSDIRWLEAQLPLVSRFYNGALTRDKAMVKNLLAEMDLEEISSAVLIAGGFHTSGIEKILEESGVSYITIVPNVSGSDHGNAYAELISGSRSDYESLLEGTLNFLAYQSLLASVPMVDAVSKQIFTTDYKIQSLLQLADKELLKDRSIQELFEQNPILARQAFLDSVNLMLGTYSDRLDGIKIIDTAILKTGERYYKLDIRGKEVAFKIVSKKPIKPSVSIGSQILADLDRITNNSIVDDLGEIGRLEVISIRPDGFDSAVSYAATHDLIGGVNVPTVAGLTLSDVVLTLSDQAKLLNTIYQAISKGEETLSLDFLVEQIQSDDARLAGAFFDKIDSAIIDRKESLDVATVYLTPELKFIASLYATAGNVRRLDEIPGFGELKGVDKSWAGKKIYIEKSLDQQQISDLKQDVPLPVILGFMEILKSPVVSTGILNYEINAVRDTDYVKVVMTAPSVRPHNIQDRYPEIVTVKQKVDVFSPVGQVQSLPVEEAYINIDIATGRISIASVDRLSGEMREIMVVSPESMLDFIERFQATLIDQKQQFDLEKLKAEIRSDSVGVMSFFASYPEQFASFIKEQKKSAREYTDQSGLLHPHIIEGLMVDRGNGLEAPISIGLVEHNPSQVTKDFLKGKSAVSIQIFNQLIEAIRVLPLAEQKKIDADEFLVHLQKTLGDDNVNCAVYSLIQAYSEGIEDVVLALSDERLEALRQFTPQQLATALVYCIDHVYQGVSPDKMLDSSGKIMSSMFAVAKSIEIMSMINPRSEGMIETAGFLLGTDESTIRANLLEMLRQQDSLVVRIIRPDGIPHFIFVKAIGANIYLKDNSRPEDQQGEMSTESFFAEYGKYLTGEAISQKPRRVPAGVAGLSGEQMLDLKGSGGIFSGISNRLDVFFGETIFDRMTYAKFGFRERDYSLWGIDDDDDIWGKLWRKIFGVLDSDTGWSLTRGRTVDGDPILNFQIEIKGIGRVEDNIDQINSQLSDRFNKMFAVVYPEKKMEFIADIANNKFEIFVYKDGEKTEVIPYSEVLKSDRLVMDENFVSKAMESYELFKNGYFPSAQVGNGASVAVLFRGNIRLYQLFRRFMRYYYGHRFVSHGETELIAMLFLKMGMFILPDGSIISLSGEETLKRVFRLMTTVEVLMHASEILKKQHEYSEKYIEEFIAQLRERGIDELMLRQFYDRYYKEQDVFRKYPDFVVEFIDAVLSNPSKTLDDFYINDKNRFFGRDHYYDLADDLIKEFDVYRVTELLGTTIKDDFRATILWLADKERPESLSALSKEEQATVLAKSIKEARKLLSDRAVDRLLNFVKFLGSVPSSRWDSEIKDFEEFVLSAKKAIDVLGGGENNSAISFSAHTGQDSYAVLAGRLNQNAPDYYIGIADGNVYPVSDLDALGVDIGEEKRSLIIPDPFESGAPMLKVVEGEVYAVKLNHGEIVWINQTDVNKKTIEEIADAIQVLNVNTGEKYFAKPERFKTIWTTQLSKKYSVEQIKRVAQAVTAKWNLGDFGSEEISRQFVLGDSYTKQMAREIDISELLSEDERLNKAVNLSLQNRPFTRELIAIIRGIGSSETNDDLDKIFKTKINVQAKTSIITKLFYNDIAKPKIKQSLDILGKHYDGLSETNIVLNIANSLDQRDLYDDTIVIDANVLRSPALTLSTLESEINRRIYKTEIFIGLFDQLVNISQQETVVADHRAGELMRDFSDLIVVGVQISRFETTDVSLRDRVLSVLADPDNPIDNGKKLADLIWSIRKDKQVILVDKTLSIGQKQQKLLRLKVLRIRDYVDGELFSLDDEFILKTYNKIISDIDSKQVTGGFVLGLEDTGAMDAKMKAVAFSLDANQSLDARNVDLSNEPPMVNLISYNIIASSDKTDLFTDTDTLNLRDKILALKGLSPAERNRNKIVVYSLKRSSDEMANQLSFLGLTVEQGLNGYSDADVIVIGKSDITAIANVDLSDKKDAISGVFDIVENLLFNQDDKDVGRVSRGDFNLLESDKEVIEVALDLGVTIGIADMSGRKETVTFNDISNGELREIGGDRIDFLKIMGPDAIVLPATEILAVSEKVRPYLFGWFSKNQTLKQLEVYQGFLENVSLGVDLERNKKGWLDMIEKSYNALITEKQIPVIKKIMSETQSVLAEIDQAVIGVLGDQKVVDLHNSYRVTVKEMSEDFFGVDFVLGSEMRGIGVKLPKRKLEFNIGEQLKMQRNFEKSA